MPTKAYTDKEKAAYWKRKATSAPRTAVRRRTGTVTGRGFYKGFSRDAGSFLGGAVGSRWGLRQPGAAIGGALGQKFADITGFGAYSGLKKNSLVLPMNPRIKNDLEREGAVVISHREHIGTVRSSTGFEIQYELPLNPAQGGTFPWLSAVASEFTQWEPLGIIFEYVSTSGNAVSSTNNALGEVIMTVNANSLDSSYLNKTQMLNSDFAQAFAPSTNGMCPVECAPQQTTLTKLYTRYGSVKPGADIRMSDLGVLTVATSGMQAADIEVGELYVTYQIALLKPQLVQELGFLAPYCSWKATNLPTTGDALPLGDGQTYLFNNMGVTVENNNKLVLPRNTNGKFILSGYIQGSGTVIPIMPLLAYNNCAAILALRQNTVATVLNNGFTTDRMLYQTAFEIIDSSSEATIQFGLLGVMPTSLAAASWSIVQINQDAAEA